MSLSKNEFAKFVALECQKFNLLKKGLEETRVHIRESFNFYLTFYTKGKVERLTFKYFNNEITVSCDKPNENIELIKNLNTNLNRDFEKYVFLNDMDNKKFSAFVLAECIKYNLINREDSITEGLYNSKTITVASIQETKNESKFLTFSCLSDDVQISSNQLQELSPQKRKAIEESLQKDYELFNLKNNRLTFSNFNNVVLSICKEFRLLKNIHKQPIIRFYENDGYVAEISGVKSTDEKLIIKYVDGEIKLAPKQKDKLFQKTARYISNELLQKHMEKYIQNIVDVKTSVEL